MLLYSIWKMKNWVFISWVVTLKTSSVFVKIMKKRGFIINYLLTEMMKMRRQIDSQKFPKKGILFFIGVLEDVYKWFVYFFKNHFCLSFEILKSIFHIVRTTLQCLASMTDMNGYECAAFISCWHCMEFLIMNQHISK